MKLSIQSRDVRGVTVLDLSGKLVFGEECDALRERMQALLAAGRTNILLNLKGLTHSDSSGIGLLVEAVVDSPKEGWNLKLVNVAEKVRGILEVHGLLLVLDIYASEPEALASFALRKTGADITRQLAASSNATLGVLLDLLREKGVVRPDELARKEKVVRRKAQPD